MQYIGSLEEKKDNINDSDIMIIEDVEDTKKITIENLKKIITFNMDQKLENVKSTILEENKSIVNSVKDKVNATAEAYYALVRNYEFLNSAYEELKEMFHDYISKISDQKESNSSVNTTPVINTLTTKNNTVVINFTPNKDADGFYIYQNDELIYTLDNNGSISLGHENDIEISAKYDILQMQININSLEAGTEYTYKITSYTNGEDGTKNVGTSSETKTIICQ